MKKEVIQWFLDRATEPSTWKGIALLIGALGFAVDAAKIDQIGLIVGTVVGLIDVIRKEKS